jgi:hypothetical protein
MEMQFKLWYNLRANRSNIYNKNNIPNFKWVGRFKEKQVLFKKKFILSVLGIEFRVWGLLDTCFTTWATSLALFALVIFHIGSHAFYLGSPPNEIPPTSGEDACTWDYQSWPLYQITRFVCWDKLLLSFCPGWPHILILPICAFQVSRIIGMIHQAWP